MIWGIDISAKCTGWCAGDGSVTPTCDVWTGYNETATDYGLMLHQWDRDLSALADRFPPTHVIYESPLLMRFDKLPTLRRTYSLGTYLELWCLRRDVICKEDDPKNLKRRLTGDAYAKKPAMVAMARKMGVRLPGGEAAKDAADAYAAWLIGVTYYAKAHLPMWDQALFERRGKLL